jgi:hypothetical protein
MVTSSWGEAESLDVCAAASEAMVNQIVAETMEAVFLMFHKLNESSAMITLPIRTCNAKNRYRCRLK